MSDAGTKAPDFTQETENSERASLSDYRGRTVFSKEKPEGHAEEILKVL